uniref:Uncharacterized protein n=1 Tax=Ditylenchus dipsaci TaxID=166011 RepID=A0A915D4B6_9BILA
MVGVAGEQFGEFSSDIYGVSINSIGGYKFQLLLWFQNSLMLLNSLNLESKSDGAELDSSVKASNMSRERQIDNRSNEGSVFRRYQCVQEPQLENKEPSNDATPSSAVPDYFGIVKPKIVFC